MAGSKVQRNEAVVEKPRSITEQIEATEAQISEREEEAAQLEAQADSISLDDPEASIQAAARAFGIRKLLERLRANLNTLKAQAEAEEIEAKCAVIDAAAEAELEMLAGRLAKMKALIPAIGNAVREFLAVPVEVEYRDEPLGFVPQRFLEAWRTEGAMNEWWAVEQIDSALAYLAQHLGRGAASLKRAARGDDTASAMDYVNPDIASAAGRIRARLAKGGF